MGWLLLCNIILLGVSLGVLSEAQKFWNAMHVGFHTKATLVVAIVCKTLRWTHGGNKKFGFGRITNMMTQDVEALHIFIASNQLLFVLLFLLFYFTKNLAWLPSLVH
jgi:ABC-type multidrug transport system fused ATPase/permease subunit